MTHYSFCALCWGLSLPLPSIDLQTSSDCSAARYSAGWQVRGCCSILEKSTMELRLLSLRLREGFWGWGGTRVRCGKWQRRARGEGTGSMGTPKHMLGALPSTTGLPIVPGRSQDVGTGCAFCLEHFPSVSLGLALLQWCPQGLLLVGPANLPKYSRYCPVTSVSGASCFCALLFILMPP